MARIGGALKVDGTTFGAEQFSGVRHVADPVPASTFAADQTAFEAALATLVADAVSPTQAHVTAVNSAYTTLKADFAAVAPSTDLLLSINLAQISTIRVLRLALERIVSAMRSSGYLAT